MSNVYFISKVGVCKFILLLLSRSIVVLSFIWCWSFKWCRCNISVWFRCRGWKRRYIGSWCSIGSGCIIRCWSCVRVFWDSRCWCFIICWCWCIVWGIVRCRWRSYNVGFGIICFRLIVSFICWCLIIRGIGRSYGICVGGFVILYVVCWGFIFGCYIVCRCFVFRSVLCRSFFVGGVGCWWCFVFNVCCIRVGCFVILYVSLLLY